MPRIMSQFSPDRDSLVALDALLRIRESGIVESQRNGGSSNKQMVDLSTTNSMTGYPSASLAGLNNLLSGNNSHMILPQVRNYTPAQQIAAVQAAAAVAALNPFSSPSRPLLRVVQESAEVTPHEGKRKATDTNEEGELNVRREKVEAALRSKPQRGRKRDDLSDKERLELTRTRNREHAKSTRIRKKARYQELLDCEERMKTVDKEERMKTVDKEEDLKSQRCQSILSFLSIRQDMLVHVNGDNSETYSAPDNQLKMAKAGEPSEQKVDTEEKKAKSSEEYTSLLAEVVEDITQFRFDSSSMEGLKADSSEKNSCLSRMQEWDKALVSRVAQSYSEGVERYLVYKIVGSMDGIALSQDGNGFARVELIVKRKSVKVVLSGLLMTHFVSKSNRLRSARWTTLEDHCISSDSVASVGSNVTHRSSSSETTLSSSKAHPSIVSLDVDKSMETDEANGPGMTM